LRSGRSSPALQISRRIKKSQDELNKLVNRLGEKANIGILISFGVLHNPQIPDGRLFLEGFGPDLAPPLYA
jgi:hypothetical protein